ncbi:hypothetical protein KIPB_009462, partial [Kipferlia bialata]
PSQVLVVGTSSTTGGTCYILNVMDMGTEKERLEVDSEFPHIFKSDRWPDHFKLEAPSVTRVSGNKVLTYGGAYGVDTSTEDMYMLRLDKQTWSKAKNDHLISCLDSTDGHPNRPMGLRNHFAVVLGGMYVVGGGIYDPAGGQTSMWGLDMKTGLWTRLPDVPGDLWMCSGMVVGDTLHALGEYSHYTYTHSGGWVTKSTDMHWMHNCRSQAILLGRHILVFGMKHELYAYDTVSDEWQEWHIERLGGAAKTRCQINRCSGVALGPDNILFIGDEGYAALLTVTHDT